METRTYGLRLERILEAAPADVFRAWTDREAVSRWVRPADDWTIPATEVDARVGGAYRYSFRSPDGRTYTESGEVRELRPEQRLVYSSRFEGDGVVEPETLVTVEFQDLGDKTRVLVTQEGYRSRETRDAHEKGWPSFLDQLEKFLAQRG